MMLLRNNLLFGLFAIGDGAPRPRRAFTLVETMIALAMLSMLLTLAITAYVTTQSTATYNSTQVTFQLEGRRALETMIELIKQAKEIKISSNNYTTDSDTAVIAVPGIDSNQNLLSQNDIIIFNYDRTDKQLDQLTFPVSGSIRPSGTIKLANNINSVNFEYLADDSATPDSQPIVIPCITPSLDQDSWRPVNQAYAAVISDCGFGVAEGLRITLTLNKSFTRQAANVTLTDEARLRNK